MPKRITDLPQETTPSGLDVLPIVDVATNETKYVTRLDLLRDAIDTVDLKDNAVTTPKIADGSITPEKFASTNEIYAYGSIASSTANGNKTLYPVESVGITFSGGNTYTAVTKGLYFVHAQQLQSNGAVATYLAIRVNGSTKRHSYIPENVHADHNVSDMVVLNVGDSLTIAQQGATTTAWSGQHSGFLIHLIKRLP